MYSILNSSKFNLSSKRSQQNNLKIISNMKNISYLTKTIKSLKPIQNKNKLR